MCFNNPGAKGEKRGDRQGPRDNRGTRLLSGGFGAIAGTTAGGPIGGAAGLGGGLLLESMLRDPKILTALFKGGQVAKEVLPKAGKVVKGVTNILIPATSVGVGTSVD